MTFETIAIQNDLGNQAVRIPKKFKIDDDKVYAKRVSNALYLIPFHNSWQNLAESLDKFTPDFMAEKSQSDDQTRGEFSG